MRRKRGRNASNSKNLINFLGGSTTQIDLRVVKGFRVMPVLCPCYARVAGYGRCFPVLLALRPCLRLIRTQLSSDLI